MSRHSRSGWGVLAGIGVLVVAGLVLSACGQSEPAAPMADMGDGSMPQAHPAGHPSADTVLPPYANTPELKELYSFALSRPDLLAYIPCSCGCGSVGHKSNWNCYVHSVSPDGTVVFDDHAPG